MLSTSLLEDNRPCVGFGKRVLTHPIRLSRSNSPFLMELINGNTGATISHWKEVQERQKYKTKRGHVAMIMNEEIIVQVSTSKGKNSENEKKRLL
jgi:hypothetical protein